MLEDVPEDAELIEHSLKKDGVEFISLRVETRDDFIQAFDSFRPGIVLADNKLPTFDGVSALELTLNRAQFIPFIFVTGTMGEEWAVEMLKKGATDYVLKNNLNKLGSALRRAIDEVEEHKSRCKAEKALHQSENKYRMLSNSISDIFFALDKNLIYTYWNKASEEFTGVSKETVVGKSLFDLFLNLKGSYTVSKYMEALETGKKQHFLNEVIKDDKKYCLEIDVYPSADGISVIGKDITERNEFEMRERMSKTVLSLLNKQTSGKNAIMEIVDLIKQEINIDAVGIRIQENDDYPYYYSDGFSNSFVEGESHLCERDRDNDTILNHQGQPSMRCMCGAVLSGSINPSLPFFTLYGSFWTNSISDLLAESTGEIQTSIESNRCNSEGYESLALIPLRSNGSIIGLLQLNDIKKNFFSENMITFFEGISTSIGIALERIKINEKLTEYSERLESMVEERTRELRETQKQLMQKEMLAAIGELAGGVSHELLNPLGAIKNAAYFMKMESDTLPDDLQESISIIENETENAKYILTTLQDFAQPRQPFMVNVDIHAFLQRFISQYNIPQAINATLNFCDSETIIYADQVQLSRVLDSIITNSIQAIPEGGDLSISTEVAENEIALIFKNSGNGIPDDKLDQLFEPLYTTKAKGIGLGLTISRNLIEKHGGRIKISSDESVGTTTTITLPTVSEKVKLT